MVDPVSVALSALVVLVAGSLAVAFAGKRLGVLAPAMTALGLRTIYGITSIWLWGVDGSDGASYDAEAQAIAANWAGQGPPIELATGKEGWPYLLAAIYASIGHVPLIGILLNAIAGALTVIVVAAACRSLGWDRGTRPASWIQALWPIAVLWGPLLLREAIVTLLLALAFYGTVLVGNRRAFPGAALLVISGLAMIWMRGGLAFLILVGLPLTLAAALTVSRPSASGLAKGVAIAAAGIALAWPNLSARLAEARYFDDDQALVVARALDTGTTGFTQAGVVTSNPVVAFLNTALGPFPTSWGNSGLLVAGIDAVLWMGLWIAAFHGYRRLAINRWGAVLSVVPVLVLFWYLSESATNFGLIIRMRALALPLIAPLAGYGIGIYLATRRAGMVPTRLPALGPMPQRARRLAHRATHSQSD